MANVSADISAIPLWMENVTGHSMGEIKYSAADFRTYTSALQRRTGILGHDYFQVVQADNVTYAVKILPGFAVVGPYMVRMGQAVTLPLQFVTNPSQTCVHKIYLVVHDEAYSSQGIGYDAKLMTSESVGGAPAPVPTDAASYLELATITYQPNQPNVQNKDIALTATHGGGAGTTIPLASYIRPGFLQQNFVARVNDGMVRLSGNITLATGAEFIEENGYVFAQLPVTLRPKFPRMAIGATTRGVFTNPLTAKVGGMYFHLGADLDGTLAATMPTGCRTYNLILGGISYDLD